MKREILLTLEYPDDFKFDEDIFIQIVLKCMQNGITIGMKEIIREEEDG
jgi:hypothetical protein